MRSVAQMLARMRELDPAPLTVAREPAQRLVGNCRDHAVLFTSLLRQQGVPAVAILGRDLSRGQLELLKNREVIICMDGDEPGS